MAMINLSSISITWSADNIKSKGSFSVFKAFKAAKAIAGAVFRPKGSSNIALGFILIFLISSATINLCSSLQIIIGS